MATPLFLRNSALNGIGSFNDMLVAAGVGSSTGTVNTTASGTQIQWTKTAGGAVLEFISGRVPAGGFTLAGLMTFSIWALESNMNANIGARARVFKRTSGGVETEVGGGPWDDGVEFGTSLAEMVWTGTPTSTAFAENDRIIVRFYITNVGTMASGHTGEINYDAPSASTGDSFFQINENVTFKAEEQFITTAGEIASAEAFGTAVVLAEQDISVAGAIASAEAFGNATLTAVANISVAGAIASAEAFGSPTLEITSDPRFLTDAGAIASAEAFGTASVARNITSAGAIASAEAFGSPALSRVISPASIASEEAFGSPTVIPAATNVTIANGIASEEAFGTFVLTRTIRDVGAIASAEEFGEIAFSGGITYEVFPYADLQDSKLFSVARDDLASRLELEGGYEFSRPRFTGASRRTFRSGFTYVNDTVKQAVEDLWNTVHGGTTEFDWVNPSNDVTYRVRFAKPLEFRYVGIGELKRWDIAFELREVIE